MDRITARHCRRSAHRARSQYLIGFLDPTGGHVGLDVLHGVVDGEQRRDIAAPRVDLQVDVLLEQLADDRFVFGRPSVSGLGLRRTAKQMAAVRALHVDPAPPGQRG
jgi:hypothetical protein